MGIEENKEVVRRYWDELNKGNLDYMDECFADNFVNYRIDGTTLDKQGYKELNKSLLYSFPDLHAAMHDIIGESNLVSFYFTITGTWEKEYRGNSPTGNPMSIMEAYFAKL